MRPRKSYSPERENIRSHVTFALKRVLEVRNPEHSEIIVAQWFLLHLISDTEVSGLYCTLEG
jgi:hypothetical protein